MTALIQISQLNLHLGLVLGHAIVNVEDEKGVEKS
jgi:hypothetical protein